MNNESLRALYEALCLKAQANLMGIPATVPEYPGRHDGQYFSAPAPLPLSHIFCWTQSFFTGMAGLACAHTHSGETLSALNGMYEAYRAKVFDTPLDTMHDLGFLYTPYAVLMYKLTGDERMRTLAIRAAEVLAQRFVTEGSYIRAWGRMDGTIPNYVDAALAQDQFFQKSNGLAIIDCMMNLPLLFFASQETGDAHCREIAMRHADTTLRYFLRADGSVCHAYRFGPDGAPLEEFNGCGYGVGSHWARGAAWAIYGFATAWRYTRAERYYEAAVRVAEKFIALCGLDGMPPWDFRLPATMPAQPCGVRQPYMTWDICDAKNVSYIVDSSAAMITACALHELNVVRPNATFAAYVQTVTQALPAYITTDVSVPGILRRQNGNDTYTAFGDYFCMELLHRQLCGNPQFLW